MSAYLNFFKTIGTGYPAIPVPTLAAQLTSGDTMIQLSLSGTNPYGFILSRVEYDIQGPPNGSVTVTITDPAQVGLPYNYPIPSGGDGRTYTVKARYMWDIPVEMPWSNVTTTVVPTLDKAPVGGITLTYTSPVTPGQVVSFSSTVSDQDGIVSTTTQWILNHVSIPNERNSSYVVKASDIGQLLELSMTVTDSRGNTYTFHSNSVYVEAATSSGTPTIISNGVFISGSVPVGTVLTANPGSLSLGGQTPNNITYEWSDGTNNATGSSYTIQVVDIGKTLFLKAYFWDSSGKAYVVQSSNSVTAIAAVHAPIGKVAIIATGGLGVGATLSPGIGTFQDEYGIDYAGSVVRWDVNGLPVVTDGPWTTTGYVIKASDIGKKIQMYGVIRDNQGNQHLSVSDELLIPGPKVVAIPQTLNLSAVDANSKIMITLDYAPHYTDNSALSSGKLVTAQVFIDPGMNSVATGNVLFNGTYAEYVHDQILLTPIPLGTYYVRVKVYDGFPTGPSSDWTSLFPITIT
jgi:hypothetical protein